VFDSDEWIPSGLNFKGDWRTGLARQRSQLTLPRRAEVLRAIHGIGGGAGSSLPAGVTAVAGQVLLLNGRPLQNVSLSIGTRSVQTDSNGEFLLSDVPSGSQTLVIDGAPASQPNRRYGRYEYYMNVQAGQLNALPFVIWMTRLDTAHAVQIASPTTDETVVTTPRIPGLELRIPANKVVRDAAGKIVTQVSITAIPVDQPPFPLPNVPVPVYFTIQPGGAHLEDVANTGSIGARLIYPNFTSSPPGARMDFWNYDSHDRGWYVYGQGSVSADGRQTIPDPGVAIYEFTGAMIGLPSNAPADGPPPDGCWWGGCGSNRKLICSDFPGAAGDPVDCYTGLFMHRRVDLRISDVVPIEIGRTYRPRDTATRSFGIGTMLAYDLFLVGDTFPYTYQDLILPDGGRIHYTRTSAGTSNVDAIYSHTSTPSAFYGSTLYWDGVGWTLQLKDGTRYKFVDSFQTTNFRKSGPYQIIDRFGNTVNLVRDAGTGEVTQIVSPNGRRITLTYDASMRITQATDDIGRTVTYTYDASGRLASVTDPANGVEQYTYDASHRMLTVVDKRNHTMVTNTYDANGRVATQTYADNTTNSFAYTLDGNGKVTQTDVTDERGAVKRLVFNSSGYPITFTRALGQTEQQVMQRVVDPATNLTSSTTDALGRITAYQYDAAGNTTQMTLLSGTANAVSWSYTYEPLYNQIATITDPLNHTTTYEYDSLGNRIRATDPLNHVTQMAYTPAGQLAGITDALNHATTLSYAGGDLVSIADPLGRTVSFAVDAVGRVVSVTDPLGNRGAIAYDPLDRVVNRTNALGHQVAFGYDANSNLTSFTDARNSVTAFAYDVRDRLISKTDALTQAETYQYDAAGNLTFVTDRKGQVRGFTYDLLGRRTQAGFGASSTTSPVYDSTITYTYDAANRVTQIADSANGTITRAYDDRFDTVTQETTPQGTVAYTYDAAGRRASMTPSGGTQASYTFDAANRITQITQGASTVQFAYDDANRRSTLTLANGITVSYGYDNASQVTSIAYRDSANNLLGDLTYAFDNAGRRTSMGGSFARTNLPVAMASATYDTNNRVSAWGGASLAHDANGNLLGFQGDTYGWNSRDELSGITGTNTASFAYDALGRRQAKTVAGAATQFLYDGINPIQELSGTTVTANVLTGLGVDEYLMRSEGANVQHYLTDALGSTMRLTDNTAAKLVDYTYEPYGNASADAGSTNAFQFTGRENDGTRLNYFRARYQSPVLGRFVSEDPIGLIGGANAYVYVSDNPVDFSDPNGLMGYGGGGSTNRNSLGNTTDPSFVKGVGRTVTTAARACRDAVCNFIYGQPYNPRPYVLEDPKSWLCPAPQPQPPSTSSSPRD
jgi:RHS repeat-associated protein